MPKIRLSEGPAHLRALVDDPPSERTLRRYIDRGLLPAYRLGSRNLRVDTADLDALIKPRTNSDSAR